MALITYLLLSLLIIITTYLYLLKKKLDGPSSHDIKTRPCPTPAELDAVNYKDIDMTSVVPPKTGLNYAVTGGCGALGTALIDLLILRGDTNIRCIDVLPLPTDNTRFEYVKADLTDPKSTTEALSKPFKNGRTVDVIFHTAAVMIFWDRGDRLYEFSRRINVGGTQNVISAATSSKASILISTSSGIVSLAKHDLWNIFSQRNFTMDDKVEFPITTDSVYTRSKRESEKLVRAAHGKGGLKTGTIRAAMGVRSYKGFSRDLVERILKDPAHKGLANNYAQSYICCYDLAAAHLCMEGKLRAEVAGVGGATFLVTGKDEQRPYTLKETRKIWNHYLGHAGVQFGDNNILIVYIIGHIVENILYVCSLFNYKPKLGEVEMAQPSVFDIITTDIVVDDSKAKKILGYKPQWTTEQTIKWIVDMYRGGHK